MDQGKFFALIAEDPSGCHMWVGSKSSLGYGRFSVAGKQQYAHRLAWEIKTGVRIPPGLVVYQTCKNRACVNPDHLRIGTQADNLKRTLAHYERVRWAEKYPEVAQFDNTDVWLIHLLRKVGMPVGEIAKALKVSSHKMAHFFRKKKKR